MSESSDPYLYPGTDVLRNIPGIPNREDLTTFETLNSGARMYELRLQPTAGNFDIRHLKAIHKYIFQDVYLWAGQFRTTLLGKAQFAGGPITYFTPPHLLEHEAQRILDGLHRANLLKGLSRSEFARKAARLLVELNNLHPYREGNGRTQRIFVEALARQAGQTLYFDVVSQERMIRASILSTTGDDFALGEVPARCQWALDVGCGRGALTRKLVPLSDEVIGIDSDHGCLDQARTAHGGTNLTFLEGDVLTEPLPFQNFDFIVAVATLHHLPLRRALERFRDLLRPGGVLVIVGLYKIATPIDYAYSAAAMPISIAIRFLRGQDEVGAPRQDPSETLATIRRESTVLLPGSVLPLRANIDETVLPVVITEQGENRNQCEEQRYILSFSPGFACR